jgi:hypothetical protein
MSRWGFMMNRCPSRARQELKELWQGLGSNQPAHSRQGGGTSGWGKSVRASAAWVQMVV